MPSRRRVKPLAAIHRSFSHCHLRNPLKQTLSISSMPVHHWLMTNPNRINSFAATEIAQAQVLILGSMPGVASLRAAQYYAHPRNAFWPLMARLCDFDATSSYEARLDALHRTGIGLWDVLASCERSGSLDAAIAPQSVRINSIALMLNAQPTLRAIALNGETAAKLFRKFVLPEMTDTRRASVQVFALPSTSPAHASKSFEEKWQAWQVLKPYLLRNSSTALCP